MSKLTENFQIVKGNLLKDFSGDIVAHQVNCKGVMGGGIARQIKDIYPDTYMEYNCFCNEEEYLLGKMLISNTPKYKIANLFGQDGFARGSRQTNYMALESSLNKLKNYMQANFIESVGFPYMIGCGLAGGDTDVVMDMIKRVFKNTYIEVTFYDYN